MDKYIDIKEYTIRIYNLCKKNSNDIDKDVEKYISEVKSYITTNIPEFCDYNYIYAKYILAHKKPAIAKDYINAALISYHMGHLEVEYQELLALWVDISGRLNEYNQIKKIFSSYTNWDFSNEEVKKRITSWMDKLNYPNMSYIYTNHKNLKNKFIGSKFIVSNYSKAMQDMFVLSILNGKRNGTYLELGVTKYNYNNNTYLLESLFSWKGLSIEYNKDLVNEFNSIRKNKCVYADSLKLNYEYLLKEKFDSDRIDYLQISLDSPILSFNTLEKIINTNIRFSIITFKHNEYNYGNDIKMKSREFLESKGYILAIPDVKSLNIENSNFEDWWIDSRIINENINKTISTLVDNYYDGHPYNFFYTTS